MNSDPSQDGGIKNEIRNAPEVHYFAGRSRLKPVIVLVAYGVGALQLGGWALSGALLGIEFLLAVLTLHCVFPLAIILALRPSCSVISWSPDDLVWRVIERASPSPADAEVRRLSICLDMCGSILLKIEHWSGRSKWLWLDRVNDPDEWKSIRRALYSPATTRLFQGR